MVVSWFEEIHWRHSLLKGRAHQLVIRCQMVSPENIRTNNIKQTEQTVFVFRIIYVYTYMRVIAIKWSTWIWMRARRSIWEDLEKGKKGEKWFNNSITSSQRKQILKNVKCIGNGSVFQVQKGLSAYIRPWVRHLPCRRRGRGGPRIWGEVETK